jgi:hypothetical protein
VVSGIKCSWKIKQNPFTVIQWCVSWHHHYKRVSVLWNFLFIYKQTVWCHLCFSSGYVH